MKSNISEHPVKYIVISPVYNEEAYIKGLIESMRNQTITPLVWILVDDGSTDRTAAIIKEHSDEIPFLKLVQKNTGLSKGDGLARASDAKAFNFGLAHAKDYDYEFIIRIEADTLFNKDYFERLLREFKKDTRLGIAGGRCLINRNGKLVLEKGAESYVFGGTKVYRKECFEDIGGMVEYLGWDLIDEVRAQMHGWRTKNFKDINIVHLRLTGSAGGIVSGKIRHGMAAYVVGYHPLFMGLRSLRRMIDKPYITGGALMFWGYCLGYIRREERFPDPDMRRYLRSMQLRRLFSRRMLTG